MSFDAETIKNLCVLARLKLPPRDEERFMKDIAGILAWVDQLKEVDVASVEPLISVSSQPSRPRADIVTEENAPEELLANAPEAAHGFYVVPKMVE